MHFPILHTMPSVQLMGWSLMHWPALMTVAAADPRHAVLHVRFGDDTTSCPTGNAQTVDAEQALQQLQEGRSWAALICCADAQLQSIYTWLMQLRQLPQGREATVVTLVDDLGGIAPPRLLRAGADLVLPISTPPAQLRLQIERLGQRLSHAPVGDLELAPGLVLMSSTRELEQAASRHLLPPQSLRLLWVLGSNPGRVLSIMRLRLALDIPAAADDQALHTAIARLRRQLRPLGLSESLQTVHGAGYRWRHEAVPAELGARIST